MALYLPTDAVSGTPIDVDLAADYLELTAFFAEDSVARTSSLANAASLAAAEDHADIAREMEYGEGICLVGDLPINTGRNGA